MKKKVLFVLLFAALGLLALQVPFTELAGSRVKFTLFDFFGPVAASFIGTIPGIVAVFLMQFVNFLTHGAEVVDAGTIVRFFPMLFAAWYFGRKNRAVLAVPILAIIAFNLHPIGRTVWYYSLFWVIPLIAYRFYNFLPARALGATFTAHAVGGALWIHVFNLKASVWISLIPVVAAERLLFALGIAATYLVFKKILFYLGKRISFLRILTHEANPN